jgi:hypothetical protein
MMASLCVGALVLLRSKHGTGQLHGTPVVLLDLVASIDRRRSGGSRRGWQRGLVLQKGWLSSGFYRERLPTCSTRILKPIPTHANSYSNEI